MVLESREATKTYGRKTAVDHVSLELEAGFVYAMLGPNGSGKTTWMKMAAGLVKPNSGGILLPESAYRHREQERDRLYVHRTLLLQLDDGSRCGKIL